MNENNQDEQWCFIHDEVPLIVEYYHDIDTLTIEDNCGKRLVTVGNLNKNHNFSTMSEKQKMDMIIGCI